MVTDVCMPDGDGLELMRRVRAADIFYGRDRVDRVWHSGAGGPGHAKRRLRLPDQAILFRTVAVSRGAGDAELGRQTGL